MSTTNTMLSAMSSSLELSSRCRALALLVRSHFHTPGSVCGNESGSANGILATKMEDPVQDETAPPDFTNYEGSEPFFITDAHILCCAFVLLSALLVPIATKVLTAAARRLSYLRSDLSFELQARDTHHAVVENTTFYPPIY